MSKDKKQMMKELILSALSLSDKPMSEMELMDKASNENKAADMCGKSGLVMMRIALYELTRNGYIIRTETSYALSRPVALGFAAEARADHGDGFRIVSPGQASVPERLLRLIEVSRFSSRPDEIRVFRSDDGAGCEVSASFSMSATNAAILELSDAFYDESVFVRNIGADENVVGVRLPDDPMRDFAVGVRSREFVLRRTSGEVNCYAIA